MSSPASGIVLLTPYYSHTEKATGFSPFELLYGRTVRGPVQILKELWTGETDKTEVKTSYQYVFELRERLDNTMKIAQEELLKSWKKNKTLYDRRAKRREFQEVTRFYCYCRRTQTSF